MISGGPNAARRRHSSIATRRRGRALLGSFRRRSSRSPRDRLLSPLSRPFRFQRQPQVPSSRRFKTSVAKNAPGDKYQPATEFPPLPSLARRDTQHSVAIFVAVMYAPTQLSSCCLPRPFSLSAPFCRQKSDSRQNSDGRQNATISESASPSEPAGGDGE